ncbi:MAG TPA: hemerythrin domain-containing protein [Candidatus Eisenbacteria bacterium]|nr:hemerythrin domain-containing protein [Candidatus Eisenbacteria bacterium]
MGDAIDVLLEDHRRIAGQLAPLRAAARPPDAGAGPAIMRPGLNLAGVVHALGEALAAHARKEDEVLFPALERVFGEGGGPTAAMRDEHRDIHEQTARFRATLHELEEVEHPAIVAGGARLGALAAGDADAATLHAAAGRLLALIDAHFEKEEMILFPMARDMLTGEALAALAEDMERLGRA